MTRQKLLILHKKIGVIYSPFFILTSLTGILLLFRKDEFYSKDVKSILIGLHNWEFGAKYIGVFLAFGLLFQSFSGLYLYFKQKAQ
ncbi:MAG: hypothetical protein HN576_09585 [Bacteriovoracaceae bacterium]|jgi:uncharacterized iron-regulated membrane protein|nr:hypothetical protein [Bacteriovoracaceae bacterium]